METKITLTAAQAKQLAEQTKKKNLMGKCEDCIYFEWASEGVPCCLGGGDACIDEGYKDFKQKPITLVLKREQLGNGREDDMVSSPHAAQCVEKGEAGSNPATTTQILPKVGEEIELVCGECGGKGKIKGRFTRKGISYVEKRLVRDDCLKECPTCKGKGSWMVKVLSIKCCKGYGFDNEEYAIEVLQC